MTGKELVLVKVKDVLPAHRGVGIFLEAGKKLFVIQVDVTAGYTLGMQHIGQISGDDLLYLLRKVGPEVFADFTIDSDKEKKHIQPEDLVKEFLKNKDNSN